MANKVGAKGQVVIPKVIRDQLGIEPGDELVFEVDGNAVVARHAEDLLSMRGILAGTSALADLEEERRRDRESEEADDVRWDVPAAG